MPTTPRKFKKYTAAERKALGLDEVPTTMYDSTRYPSLRPSVRPPEREETIGDNVRVMLEVLP